MPSVVRTAIIVSGNASVTSQCYQHGDVTFKTLPMYRDVITSSKLCWIFYFFTSRDKDKTALLRDAVHQTSLWPLTPMGMSVGPYHVRTEFYYCISISLWSEPCAGNYVIFSSYFTINIGCMECWVSIAFHIMRVIYLCLTVLSFRFKMWQWYVVSLIFTLKAGSCGGALASLVVPC